MNTTTLDNAKRLLTLCEQSAWGHSEDCAKVMIANRMHESANVGSVIVILMAWKWSGNVPAEHLQTLTDTVKELSELSGQVTAAQDE